MANSVPPQVRLSVYLKADKKCYYCGQSMGWEDFTIDHVHSKAEGGKNKKSNYVCCCNDCNNVKGSMSVEQFDNFINNLHIILRNNQMWRVMLKHFKVKLSRKTSFVEKYKNDFEDEKA